MDTTPAPAADLSPLDLAINGWLRGAQAKVDAQYAKASIVPQLLLERGRRYIRVVSEERADGRVIARSAFAFIDTTNGNVLKPDGWKGRAKGARGSVYQAPGDGVSAYGALYAR